jgi:hypothetical protein
MAMETRESIVRLALAALSITAASCARTPSDSENVGSEAQPTVVEHCKEKGCKEHKNVCEPACFEVESKASHGYVTVSESSCEYTITVDGHPAHIINGEPPQCAGDTVFTIPGNEEKNTATVCVLLEGCAADVSEVDVSLELKHGGDECTPIEETVECEEKCVKKCDKHDCHTCDKSGCKDP